MTQSGMDNLNDDRRAQALAPAAIASADAPFTFNGFAPFNDAHLGVFRIEGRQEGDAPWEMHPDTDELLQVHSGSVTVEIHRPDAANDLIPLVAGELVVVPQGRWHRHRDAVDLVEMFFTPGESLHSDDPASEPHQ